MNLISNSIKFTPASKNILVAISSKKGFVKIEVKDEGVGIPKDKIDIIFERFGKGDSTSSRQEEGVGLGLSLVKVYIEALGGRGAVKSKVGNGSTLNDYYRVYK